MAAVWGYPKHFSVQNNMEVVKSDGETMRSLCAYWYVCGGVRSRHWKWWGELRKDEGEEECRGEESINK